MLRLLIALLLTIGSALPAWTQADVVLVVHPENPLQALDSATVKRLYLGQSRRFPDGTSAQFMALPDNHALTQSFFHSVLNMSDSQVKTHWATLVFTGRGQPPGEMQTQAQLIEWLGRTPNGITFVHPLKVDDTVKVVLTVSGEQP